MQWQPSQQPDEMSAAPYAVANTYNYPSYGGADQNWQNNSQPYSTNAAPAQPNQFAQNQATKAQNICGEADGVRYEILYRDVNSIVQCHLQPNASMNIEAGGTCVH